MNEVEGASKENRVSAVRRSRRQRFGEIKVEDGVSIIKIKVITRFSVKF